MRPRPVVTQDDAFFFEGAREHRLLVQRCVGCAQLRHPPGPRCAACGSYEWNALEASGRGTVYSYVVVHHPQLRGIEYPHTVALVTLEEGTRLVADLVDVSPDDVTIGMPVEVLFVDHGDELTLPAFRPTPAPTP